MTFVQVVAVLDSTYAIALPPSWYDWVGWLRFLGRLDWANWYDSEHRPPDHTDKNQIYSSCIDDCPQ